MKSAAEAKVNTGRILVKPEESLDQQSVVIRPDSNKEVPQHGRVIKVGKRKKPEDEFVSEGDIVVYGKYAGTMLKFSDGEHLVIPEADILAIV